MALPRRQPPPPAPPAAGEAQYPLARLALRVLDARRTYFREKRGLDECKGLEEQLRAVALADGTDLGELALLTLDRPRAFFGSGDRQLLQECRQLERRLRDAADLLLHPPTVQPTLFGE